MVSSIRTSSLPSIVSFSLPAMIFFFFFRTGARRIVIYHSIQPRYVFHGLFIAPGGVFTRVCVCVLRNLNSFMYGQRYDGGGKSCGYVKYFGGSKFNGYDCWYTCCKMFFFVYNKHSFVWIESFFILNNSCEILNYRTGLECLWQRVKKSKGSVITIFLLFPCNFEFTWRHSWVLLINNLAE